MSALNPGRDAEIRRVAAAYGACGDKLMDLDAAQALVLSGVDRGMTDQEIRFLVEFYEGPDYRALQALAAKVAEDQMDAEAMKRMEALAGNPVFVRFMQVMTTEVTNYTSSPAFIDGARICHTQYRAAADKAGLKLD